MIKCLLVNMMVIAAATADPASDQLPNFRKEHACPIGILTTSNGAPVDIRDTRVLHTSMFSNDFFIESMAHMNRQEIPQRVVHAKGAGAFGHFTVTHNISDICRAKVFSENGKKTPIAVRFSQSSSDRGELDTKRDTRGFALKFYTCEGNFDLVGFHTPMFIIKEPFLFNPLVRAIRRNPVTNLRDANIFWDFICLNPETINLVTYFFGDNGIPDGYRYMPGFSIHTYQVYNECGKSSWIRFVWTPDLGVRNLGVEDAARLASIDLDYAVRDLYNAIANGNFPSWTLSVQVLDAKDIENCDFDPFDMTMELPVDKYPLRTVGTLVLDRNPSNYFADVEQIAFCPSNRVPGIGTPSDQIFQARRFAYRDTQRYRLGVNFNKIRVNSPLSKVLSYDRDGVAPVGCNGGDSPNYFPNSFNGPIPSNDRNRPRLMTRYERNDPYNFKQPTARYNNMSNEERSRLVRNILSSLSYADEHLQKNAVALFNLVHRDLGYRIAVGLAGNCT